MFFRGCDENMKITKELLEMTPMHGDTTSESMFNAVWNIFEKFKLPLDGLVAVTTDGSKEMVGKHKGLITRLRKQLQDIYLFLLGTKIPRS